MNNYFVLTVIMMIPFNYINIITDRCDRCDSNATDATQIRQMQQNSKHSPLTHAPTTKTCQTNKHSVDFLVKVISVGCDMSRITLTQQKNTIVAMSRRMLTCFCIFCINSHSFAFFILFHFFHFSFFPF